MKSLLLIASLFILISCNPNNGSPNTDVVETIEKTDIESDEEAVFVHTVFFWMKEDFSEEDAKFFEDGLEKLGKVPSIHSYKWGKPAGTPRDVVDNSYTYAWIVDFTSAEKQDEYQVDPIHLKFIEECDGLWTKVQVYDTILE